MEGAEDRATTFLTVSVDDEDEAPGILGRVVLFKATIPPEIEFVLFPDLSTSDIADGGRDGKGVLKAAESLRLPAARDEGAGVASAIPLAAIVLLI